MTRRKQLLELLPWGQLLGRPVTNEIVRGDSIGFVASMASGCVDLIINDPPYGGIVAEAWDKKWNIDAQFSMTRTMEHALKIGGTAYVWGGVGKYQNRIFFEWLSRVESESTFQIWDIITWAKRRFYGVKDRYGFTREECAMLVKTSDRPATFHVPLLDELRGYKGFNKKYPAKSPYKRRTNVWTDVSELFTGKIHPTEKPSRLAEIMIETSSNPSELVLDMYAGSGSTGVAAKKLGRESLCIELGSGPMHGDALAKVRAL